ncbi:MAG: hypothetical protein ACTSQ9_05465 [Candidatus Hodarchaeales archaeon]
MQFTKTDLISGISFSVMIYLDIFFQISANLDLFRFLAIIAFFIMFLIWAMILTYNLATLSIDYAYPDKLYNQSGARKRRLIRSAVLTAVVCILFFVTLIFIDRTADLFLGLFSWILIFLIFNFYCLRIAFQILGSEENPYFLYKQYQ